VHGRTALAVLLVIGAGSTACSSDGSKQADPYCTKLTAVSRRLVSAEQDLFRGGGSGQQAVAAIVAELRDVQSGAPAGIRGALAHLATAFQRAEPALAQPTGQGRKDLADAAHVLSTDGKKLSDYVTSKCK
jgi:hypothetical protein